MMVKYHSTVAHEMAWPHTVASALPCTPQPSTMTNRKLKMVHDTAPMIMVPSARFGAPAVRMKLFTPMPMHWNTKPNAMIWMNERAYSQSSGVAPDTLSRPFTHAGMNMATATITANTMDRHTVLPRLRSASTRLPSPMRSAASALPPLPTSMAIAMNTVMMGIATVAVARPISPMACPRNTESITLYAPLTNMPKMDGMANSTMRRGMDAVPMRLTLSSRAGRFGSMPTGAPVLSSARSGMGFVASAAMRSSLPFRFSDSEERHIVTCTKTARNHGLHIHNSYTNKRAFIRGGPPPSTRESRPRLRRAAGGVPLHRRVPPCPPTAAHRIGPPRSRSGRAGSHAR